MMRRPISPKVANYLNWGEMSSNVLMNSRNVMMSGCSYRFPTDKSRGGACGAGLVKWLKFAVVPL
jgi:hypothetical protein